MFFGIVISSIVEFSLISFTIRNLVLLRKYKCYRESDLNSKRRRWQTWMIVENATEHTKQIQSIKSSTSISIDQSTAWVERVDRTPFKKERDVRSLTMCTPQSKLKIVFQTLTNGFKTLLYSSQSLHLCASHWWKILRLIHSHPKLTHCFYYSRQWDVDTTKWHSTEIHDSGTVLELTRRKKLLPWLHY